MKPHRAFLAAALSALVGASGCAHNAAADDSNWVTQTAPAPCPEGPNDLAGLEGWAPGAGKAEQMGQNAASQFGGFGSALGGSAAATPTPAATGCMGMSPQTAARFDAIAAAIKTLPTDSYDVAARAQSLNAPEAAFAFVRDRIHTEDYAGVVRGGVGTLMSQAGNPDDKIVLLAALLQAEGTAVRYVHAPLTDADLANIDSATLATPPPAATPSPPTSPDPTIDPDAEQNLATFAASAQARLDSGVANGRSATDPLVSLLAAQNRGLATDSNAALARMHAVERDHWWLQAQLNGAWVDLDPTLASSQPGQHIGADPQDAPADALPDARYATITVRLIADNLAGGTLGSATLIERTARAADVYGIPLSVSVTGDAPDLAHTAQSTTFTPSIAFGDDAQSGSAFTPDDPSGTKLARLRLQIVDTVPGHDTNTQDRVVANRLDATGEAIDPSWTPARTAYALTTSYAGFAVGGDLSAAYTLLFEGRALRAARAMVAYADAGAAAPGQLPDDASDTDAIDVMRYLRFDQGVRDRFASATERFVVDRPQIAFERLSMMPSTSSPFTMQLTFDIFENGVLPLGGASAIRDNVTRGYVDTAIESNLIGGGNGGGTREIFAAATAGGIGSRVITTQNAAGVPPSSVAALAQTLQSGVAIAPARAVQLNGAATFGWWAIDPATGNTIGRTESGGGQSMVERAILVVKVAFRNLNYVMAIANIGLCFYASATSAIPNADPAFKSCLATALCVFLTNLLLGSAFGKADASDLWQIIKVENLLLGKAGFGPSSSFVCKAAVNAFG